MEIGRTRQRVLGCITLVSGRSLFFLSLTACSSGQRASLIDPCDRQIPTHNIPVFILIYCRVVSKEKMIRITNLRFSDALLRPEPEVSLFCGQDQCLGALENGCRDDLLADRLNADVATLIDRAEEQNRAGAHPRGEHQKRRAEPELAGQAPEQGKSSESAQRRAKAQQDLMLEDCGEGLEGIPDHFQFHSNTTRFFFSRPRTASTTLSRLSAWAIFASRIPSSMVSSE